MCSKMGYEFTVMHKNEEVALCMYLQIIMNTFYLQRLFYSGIYERLAMEPDSRCLKVLLKQLKRYEKQLKKDVSLRDLQMKQSKKEIEFIEKSPKI